MKLQTKLLVTKVTLATLPVAIVASIVVWQSSSAVDGILAQSRQVMAQEAELARDALVDSGVTDLTHVAETVHAMCVSQQALLEQKIGGDLNVAEHVLNQTGSVSFSEELATWDATNQFTGETQQLELPKLLVGEQWFGQNFDLSATTPVVDAVKGLVGGTCTVFQRMNESGDMLRVATNVQKNDGTRSDRHVHPRHQPRRHAECGHQTPCSTARRSTVGRTLSMDGTSLHTSRYSTRRSA